MSIELAAPLEDCVRDVVDIDFLRPRWMRDAACRGQGFDTWFPADEVGEQAETARRICAGCAVRAECLDYALEARVRHGLWGGLTTRERAALARGRGPGPADACRRHYAS